MSGRKYSQMELAAQVREAIQCRMLSEQAICAAETLAAALGESARTVPALEGAAKAAKDTLDRFAAESRLLGAAVSSIDLMSMDLASVHATRQRFIELREQVEAVARSCRESCGAASVRMDADRLLRQTVRDDDILNQWLGEDYHRFRERAEWTLRETDLEIRSTGTAARAATLVRDLCEEHDRLRQHVAHNQEQDAQRRYIAESLVRICRVDLGFDARLLPQKAPIEDLVIEVDTFAYGLIRFRLGIDGLMRSQSEMVNACPANFKTIEERLRSLGVFSDFRYEADQRPVVNDRDEKPLPADVQNMQTGAL